MAKYYSGQAITANDDYDFPLDPGKRYMFEVFYPSGVTATVAPKRLAPDGGTYQPMTWGTDPASDAAMSIAATGTAKGAVFSATSKLARFTVSSLTGGWIYISINEVPQGR